MATLPSFSAVLASPIGKLGIVVRNEALARLAFLPSSTDICPAQDDCAKEVVDGLMHYFHNPHYTFTLNLHLIGTPFQKSVWEQLQRIPSGKTLSYGELAKQLQTSPRAIGNACRANPIPVVVPCHRIVAANHIGGFAGQTTGQLLDMKTWLINHEAI